TDGDVGVDAQRSLLHLRVRHAELHDRLPQKLQESLRLLGRANVRRRDDLDQRRAAAIEVDERVRGAADAPGVAADMERLRGVLLEMRTYDPDHMVICAKWDCHSAVYARR